jgi:endonuclease/exonuclease/phosphatase family metal-dependent hydrolase
MTFNCPADDGSLAPLRSHWTHTCRAVPTESSREAEEIGTLHESRARIDHIFVDLRHFTVENAGLAPKAHRQASDHTPYSADIKRLSYF